MKNVKYALRLSDEDRVISNVQPNELQYVNHNTKQKNSFFVFFLDDVIYYLIVKN
jgi:hypothetical protein